MSKAEFPEVPKDVVDQIESAGADDYSRAAARQRIAEAMAGDKITAHKDSLPPEAHMHQVEDLGNGVQRVTIANTDGSSTSSGEPLKSLPSEAYQNNYGNIDWGDN